MELRETRQLASEIKFLVTPAIAEKIEHWATRWLQPDPHGAHYNVTSLYFDTPNRDVFRRTGSYARGKYRIRRYNNLDFAFLERKLRSQQIVAKRRSAIEIEDLPLLDHHATNPLWTPGFWFHRRLQVRNLAPAWQVSYQRTARVLDTKFGLIRLTLDRDLRAMPARSFGFETEEQGTPVFADQSCILELKFRTRMPSIFRDLTNELSLTPQPVSKFRLAAAAHA